MKQPNDNVTRTAVATTVSTICASIILYIIFGFTGDSKKAQDVLKNKAEIEYVDKKCLEVKEDAKRDKTEILIRLGELQQQNNQLFQQNSEIYQAIIELKK